MRIGRFARLGRAAGALCIAAALHANAVAQQPDPRTGLRPGLRDAGTAVRNLELVASVPRPEGFFNPAQPGDFLTANSDIAFRQNLLFLGNFAGFQIYDITDPRAPNLRTGFVCPGGQGDLSVHGNLLFMSVEMPNGRTDCGTQGTFDPVNPERFRGVRIFDITDLSKPKQVGAVQTCRGSHTHTLVPDPRDRTHVYIYVSGAMPPRSAAEMPGCSAAPPEQDTATALFRIEVIHVPLANPQQARIVNMPRIFARAGQIAGLWRGGSHGPGTQTTATTDQCHDITVYSELGIAAGACSGNGILLDITNPRDPVRVAEVLDPNFAYWHSATFNNEGSKVIFTDEWGGGVQPRCRETDRKEWGANAIFELNNRTLRQVSYYKLPAPQGPTENCVAHNGSLIPVPGRDIMVQAWYQGGVSVFDFTDASKPVEIAYFDRGAMDANQLMLGGYWSAYWYNGHIYGSEIGRGLDVFRLVPNEQLSQNEIEAANLVRQDVFNPQTQTRIVWPASFVVARAYLDQLKRGNAVPAAELTRIGDELNRVERLSATQRRAALTQLATSLGRLSAPAADGRRLAALAQTVRDLAR